jgi:hypothetical protein
MKRASIILVVIGLIVLIGGNFFYKKDSNPVDTAGTREISRTATGDWAPKIPVFMGGVLVALGVIFYIASRSRVGNTGNNI